MAYCTQNDILAQLDGAVLIQLTDDEATGSVDSAVVERAIADAAAAIDAYCQGRYSVPLSPVPDMIRQLSVDMAIYHLYSRRGDVMPETRGERYRNAIRFLERVAAGTITLGAATPVPEVTSHDVNIASSDRVFSRRSLRGF